MHYKSLLALAASTMLCHHAMSQEVQQVSIGDNMNFGITYTLPKTGFLITVNTTYTQNAAGQYAAFAEKFLGLDNVLLEDDFRWEIESATIECIARPDTSRSFHIDFSEKAALPTFYFTKERSLWSINQKPEVKKPVVTPSVKENADESRLEVSASDLLTSEILKAGSKVKQAEMLAREIFSIRESRTLLIKGEADNMPGDGASLQLMLDNLNAQEQALMTLFEGETVVTHKQFTLEYFPEKAVEKEVLFRLSELLGYLDKDDLAGAPCYINVAITEDNRMMEVDDKAAKKSGMFGSKSGEKGLAFCVPGKARVRLFTLDKTLAECEVDMAQFGHVEQLPASKFTDKKKPTSALFVPETGAIRIFEQTSLQ